MTAMTSQTDRERTNSLSENEKGRNKERLQEIEGEMAKGICKHMDVNSHSNKYGTTIQPFINASKMPLFVNPLLILPSPSCLSFDV